MAMHKPLTDRANVTYAIVGHGAALHYSPRNDETLCRREIRAYIDDVQACELLDEQGMKMCKLCVRAAEKRATAAEAAITPEAERDTVKTAGAPQTIEAAVEVMRSARYVGTRTDAARTAGELYRALDDDARAAMPCTLANVLDVIGYTDNEAALVVLSKRAVELWDEQPAAPTETAEAQQPADEPSDMWTIMTRAGEEIARVEGATAADMARAAEALPEVQASIRSEGGFARRRLYRSELRPNDAERDVVAEAELLDTVEAVEEAERVGGTWRGAWIGAAPDDAALFDLAPAEAEQGALFT